MVKWVKQESDFNVWKPTEVKEELSGQVVEIKESDEYGSQYMIVKSGSDEQILTPSHKVLQTRLKKAVVGSIVKIVYEGEEPPAVKGRHPTRIYEVFIAE